jgi:hypothetical protein
MILEDLKKELPYKWRVQQAKEHGANCVAYIDARDVMNLFDKVVGAENWQDKYEAHKGNLFCSIGIKKDGDWVWKTDCGAESDIEAEKGEASDAFKRAAVKWGVGRFLYDLPIQRLKTKAHTNGKYYPIDNNGKLLFNPEDLNSYINGLMNGKTPSLTETEKPWLKDEAVDETIKYLKSKKLGIEAVEAKCRISKENRELILKGIQ